MQAVAQLEESAGEPSDHDLPSVLVERSSDVIVLLDGGTIRYVSPSIAVHTGWTPDQLVGRHVVELVHPEDLDRAVFDLELFSNSQAAPGYSTYRVTRADGSSLRMDAASADIPLGDEQYMALYCRPDHSASRGVLDGLLRGMSTAETLRLVCDVFNWQLHGSRVGISWWDRDVIHAVGTDLPAALAGGDEETVTPWAECRREGRSQRATEVAALDDGRRRQAEELGLGAYWIEPVLDDDGEACALITVWTHAGGPVPEIHMLGMAMAKDYVELIIRWSRQRRLLQDAAHTDTLTGLANRKAFFDALVSERAGAVLYCDLDRFKPVNDALGHAAGDELLRAVSARIKASVREADLVARLGGDEFAILSFDVSREQALALAQRIREAVVAPFQILGNTVRVGLSVGVAHSSDGLGEDVLDLADRALYRAKSAGGGAAM